MKIVLFYFAVDWYLFLFSYQYGDRQTDNRFCFDDFVLVNLSQLLWEAHYSQYYAFVTAFCVTLVPTNLLKSYVSQLLESVRGRLQTFCFVFSQPFFFSV